MQMPKGIGGLVGRFDEAFLIVMQNLGPQLIKRAHLGLTPGQVFMLHFIQQEERCNVSTIASKVEVSPSAATIMLDRLEQQGFVNRVRDGDDRRVVLTELTAEGEHMLDEVLQARQRIVEQCLSGLHPEELESLVTGLEILASISASLDIPALLDDGTKGVER